MRHIILLLSCVILGVVAWDDDDLEVFDVVEEVNQNFYEFMGVSQDALQSEIKSAFKQLTRKLHPDKSDAPDADVQFRNLVSIHNILKDPGKREKYNEVLKNGLPNWRSAVYYYRHVRKMGLAEGAIILLIIVTFGQYLVGWAAYAEKRYTAEQILNTRGKKQLKKSGFDTGLAEILDQLPKPSIKDTLPFQIPRAIWWSITAIPSAIVMLKERRKEQAEEEKRQKKREEEERARAEREAAMAEARAGARRRRAFVPPERDGKLPPERDGKLPPADAPAHAPEPREPAAPPVVSGGLWTDDDLSELARLLQRYPAGTARRWQLVAERLARPAPEVAHMAAKLKDNLYRPPEPEPLPEPPKKVKTRKADDIGAGAANWSQPQQRALEAALAKHPKGGSSDRWARIAAHVPGKTKEECMQRCKYLSEMLKQQKQKEEEEKRAEEERKEELKNEQVQRTNDSGQEDM